MLNSSRCNQAWSGIKTEVDKNGNSKSVIQCKNKIKALKYQHKETKESNGKPGEESKFSPFYNQFDRILNERTIFTMPELKEVVPKSVITGPKFSKSDQNNKEKSQANKRAPSLYNKGSVRYLGSGSGKDLS